MNQLSIITFLLQRHVINKQVASNLTTGNTNLSISILSREGPCVFLKAIGKLSLCIMAIPVFTNTLRERLNTGDTIRINSLQTHLQCIFGIGNQSFTLLEVVDNTLPPVCTGSSGMNQEVVVVHITFRSLGPRNSNFIIYIIANEDLDISEAVLIGASLSKVESNGVHTRTQIATSRHGQHPCIKVLPLC